MNTNNFELEEMRNQIALFKEEINKQQIVNDRLVLDIIKSKMNIFKRTIIWESALMAFIVVDFLFLGYIGTFSWPFVAFSILGVLPFAVSEIINSYRSQQVPDGNLLQTSENLVKAKRSRTQKLLWGIPFILVFCGWASYDMAHHYALDMGCTNGEVPMSCWYASAIPVIFGLVVGGIAGLVWHFSLQKRSDEIIKQIKEVSET